MLALHCLTKAKFLKNHAWCMDSYIIDYTLSHGIIGQLYNNSFSTNPFLANAANVVYNVRMSVQMA